MMHDARAMTVIEDMEQSLHVLMAIHDDIVVGDNTRLAAELRRRVPDLSARGKDMLRAAIVELLIDQASGSSDAEHALVAIGHNNPRDHFVRGFGRDTALPLRCDDVFFRLGGAQSGTVLAQPVIQFEDDSRLVPQPNNRGWEVKR